MSSDPSTEKARVFASTRSEQVQLQDFVSRLRALLEVPGLSVGVWKAGEVFEAAAGVSSLESAIPMTSRSRFDIGLINQWLTALVVLDLIAGGSIDAEATLCTYLAELCGENGDRIKVKHLLSHTAGYRAELHTQPDTTDTASYERFAASFNERPLLFEPGTTFSHTASGSMILAKIAQGITGSDVGALARRRMLDPLGIIDLAPRESEQVVGYTLRPDGKHHPFSAHPHEIWRHSLFGAVMTVRDLAVLGGAIAGKDGAIPHEARALLMKPVVQVPATLAGAYADEQFSSFTMGCARYPSGLLGVSSTENGQSCALRIDPTNDLAVAVAINTDAPAYRDRILNKLLDAFGASTRPSPAQSSPDTQTFALDELVGVYDGPLHHFVTASHEHGQLVLRASSDAEHAPQGTPRYFILKQERDGRIAPVTALARDNLGFFRDPASHAPCLQLGLNVFKRRGLATEAVGFSPTAPGWWATNLTVPADAAKARLETCFACDLYWKKTGLCSVCRCAMRLKVHFSRAHCPQGKW